MVFALCCYAKCALKRGGGQWWWRWWSLAFVLLLQLLPSAAPEAQGKLQQRREKDMQVMLLLPFEFDADTLHRNPSQISKPWVQPVIHMACEDIAALDFACNITDGDEQRLVGSGQRLLQMRYVDSQCSDIHGPVEAVQAYKHDMVDVIVGLVCSYSLAPVARMSPFWNNGVPILTPTNLVGEFSKKEDYKLLTRLSGSYTTVGNFVNKVLIYWNVTTGVSFLFHNNPPTVGFESECAFVIKEVMLTYVYSDAERQRWFRGEKAYHGFDEYSKEQGMSREYLKKELEKLSFKSGVVLLCASPNVVRNIMLAAHELNMVESGEYVFFNIDVSSGPNAEKPWERSWENEEDNAKAMSAYRALKTITLKRSNSTEYQEFEKRVRDIADTKYNYQQKMNKTYELNSFISAFYDAVVLYALALNETLRYGLSPENGTDITRRMWNRSFKGISGNVTIDENGDRYSDYSLLDFDPVSETFKPVVNYFGASQLMPLAAEGAKWHWVKDKPPKDTPVCGYDKSLCPEEGMPVYGWFIIGIFILVVFFAALIGFLYRRYQLESELSAMNWRIRWEELFDPDRERKKSMFVGFNKNLTDGHVPLRRSASKCSIQTGGSEETIQMHELSKQIFTKTTNYKGTVVAIKKLNINRQKIDLTRPILMELKKMKDIANDHIVRFLGACVDFPNYCLVTEYCPKGSLQDILENEQFKLDKMMIYSLMHDIVKGMDFIHTSDMRSHGNLKSSNCVVDSRFVLKVTDFDFHYLHQLEDPLDDENSHAFWKRKLWTAPELLRMERPPPGGTQRGDVYSFSIILHEMSFRMGAFYIDNEEVPPQELVERVKLRQEPPFRPSIDESHCDDVMIGLMTRCWAENPVDRPDFTSIRKQVRQLNREYESSNIVDNLLKRMEQYATNLEVLVEERTRDYLEEKRKAEDLLYAMLPKQVARQLISGESVKADYFDSATIYFSDIVGFTSISAESTPMEVVNLLNDLYTCFDTIIGSFDVYKVETIGDAYMVVSGIPQRNGLNHAREIARMSLALLKAVKTFTIRHRPEEQLKLRIGIHSGPAVAGVVGRKMPRYCLFGDTVNTASRMESNGMPLKIHVSSHTKQILEQFGCFEMELRGEIEMKGKGKQTTYWLQGEMQAIGSDTKAGDLLTSSVPAQLPPSAQNGQAPS